MKLDWQALPRPIIALSPMADMTDSAFCRVVRSIARHDSGRVEGSSPTIVFREMVSAEAVVRGNEKTLNMTDIHSDERPLVQQLFGSDPDVMTEAAVKIEAEHHPEGFDINMGCPVYKIVRNFNGAALMKEPALASKIIRKMKSRITVPLSVKIRLGWSDPRECVEFARVLEDAGADLLTVHGRTKCQGYAGTSDWNMIGEVKKAVSIPVLCNGDIHSADLAPQALSLSKGDGVLIARGALGNPWIFSQMQQIFSGREASPVPPEERLRVIRFHAQLHVEQYGEHALVSFRKHLLWYFKGLPGAKVLREQMLCVKSLDDLERQLKTVVR
jgi:tRNA-dihydrouridine synthase B